MVVPVCFVVLNLPVYAMRLRNFFVSLGWLNQSLLCLHITVRLISSPCFSMSGQLPMEGTDGVPVAGELRGKLLPLRVLVPLVPLRLRRHAPQGRRPARSHLLRSIE